MLAELDEDSEPSPPGVEETQHDTGKCKSTVQDRNKTTKKSVKKLAAKKRKISEESSIIVEQTKRVAEKMEATVENSVIEISDSDDTINQTIDIDLSTDKTFDSSKVRSDLGRCETPSFLNISCNVKHSLFGTPILKSTSPYSRLPNPENFMKDVSPVINFENLPNATGKYEQMADLLQKVREKVKTIQKSKT